MLLTIAIVSKDNYSGPYFTLQSLRLHQVLDGCEILLVDQSGDNRLQRKCDAWNVRYVRETTTLGTAVAKNLAFSHARGEYVLCLDSHVMLECGAVETLCEYLELSSTPNLLHGPLWHDFGGYYCGLSSAFHGVNWGEFNDKRVDKPTQIEEIAYHGMGVFCMSRQHFPGFNKSFRGHGCEEIYIHEKVRCAGLIVQLLPFLTWVHRFNDSMEMVYKDFIQQKYNNYVIAFEELGLDRTPLEQAFRGLL